jgi:hypothetical protein
MPKAVKVLVWIVVFAVCAGAGAFVASRSNPFPPGVEDPGARRSPRPTQSPGVEWALSGTSATQHVLHVGGSCQSDWDFDGSVKIDAQGRATGSGVATLSGPAGCDFPQAQVQTKSLQLQISGRQSGTKIQLEFREAGRKPVGSHDLGGLINTLSIIDPTFDVGGGATVSKGIVLASKPDGDLGTYKSNNHLQLSLQ